MSSGHQRGDHPISMRQVLVRMPVEMADALRALADDNDRTVAAEVRRACRAHLEGEQ